MWLITVECPFNNCASLVPVLRSSDSSLCNFEVLFALLLLRFLYRISFPFTAVELVGSTGVPLVITVPNEKMKCMRNKDVCI